MGVWQSARVATAHDAGGHKYLETPSDNSHPQPDLFCAAKEPAFTTLFALGADLDQAGRRARLSIAAASNHAANY